MTSNKLSILLAAAITLFAACTKDEEMGIAKTEDVTGNAFAKIIHASAYSTNNGVQLKVNDTRVSSVFTYSYPFPGGGVNTGGNSDMDYLLVTPGANEISMSVPKKGMLEDSIALFSGTTSALEAGEYYDIFISDTAANTKMLVVTENTDSVPAGYTRYRFANLIPNLPAADLYFGSQLVAGNIAYNTISSDFLLPRDSVARWALRPAGVADTVAAAATYPSGTTRYTVPNQRSMVVYSRGYVGGTGTLAPNISLFYNRYYK